MHAHNKVMHVHVRGHGAWMNAGNTAYTAAQICTRLQKRGYSQNKVEENIEAEIMQVLAFIHDSMCLCDSCVLGGTAVGVEFRELFAQVVF